MGEISPRELVERLASGPPTLIDVREPWEFDTCRIDGAINIPLETLPDRLVEFDSEARLVIICHHGMRSHYAATFLRDRGFSNVLNLSGGIDRWACEVAPSMSRY